MKLIAKTGKEDIAVVYILECSRGRWIECVESLSPPLPREKKWVLLISTLFGCPVKCMMCDAGSHYEGKLSKAEILAQIAFLVEKRYPEGSRIPGQFKIQFSRMGEPALNTEVLDVLEVLPSAVNAPGLIPSVSTVAPAGCNAFFERVLDIKNALYAEGRFQMQFSIHTTDKQLRNRLIPVKKWDLSQIAQYGERFFKAGDRKITLNFALADHVRIEPDMLLSIFDPEKFLIKITPINPTVRAEQNGLLSYIDAHDPDKEYAMVSRLRRAGYDVIVSIGETEENRIGSNCGQFLRTYLESTDQVSGGYHYALKTCRNFPAGSSV